MKRVVQRKVHANKLEAANAAALAAAAQLEATIAKNEALIDKATQQTLVIQRFSHGRGEAVILATAAMATTSTGSSDAIHHGQSRRTPPPSRRSPTSIYNTTYKPPFSTPRRKGRVIAPATPRARVHQPQCHTYGRRVAHRGEREAPEGETNSKKKEKRDAVTFALQENLQSMMTQKEAREEKYKQEKESK